MKFPELESFPTGKESSIKSKETAPHGRRLVAFDLEDLLVPAGEDNVWKRLFEAKGLLADHSRLKEEYLGQRNLKARKKWVTLESKILLKNRLTKDEFDRAVNKPIPEDTISVISTLHNRGYDTGIITGGIENVAESLREKLGMKKAVGLCKYFFNDQGIFYKYTLSDSDYEGKMDALVRFAKELGIPLSEVAYVGHGVNDRYAFKAAGFSIAVHDSHSPEGMAGANYLADVLRTVPDYIEVFWKKPSE